MTDIELHVIVHDFVAYTIPLPDWFYELGLERDCFEAPLPNSPPGSLTPPDVYARLIAHLRTYYNREKAIEIFPPRGCNEWVRRQPQMFMKYASDQTYNFEKPMISVFPRARTRASNRNVPEYIWRKVVDDLVESFTVVLSGTPSGACLGDYTHKDVINLINYSGTDKIDKTMDYLCNSVCSVSSQSGPTHLSLLCNCPSYIIGHEKKRHAIDENRLGTPVTFRYVADYRAIDAETILQDVASFIKILLSRKEVPEIDKDITLRPSLNTLVNSFSLVGAEIGVNTGDNALKMLEQLDIKKLYLIDPYTLYGDMINVGCQVSQEDCVKIKAEALVKLEPYKDKIVWIEDLSGNVADKIQEELDFVYIDGNHRKKYVANDIKLYYDKVKDGGLVAGHDYDYIGVREAVTEYFAGKDVKLCRESNTDVIDWWYYKPVSFLKVVDRDLNVLKYLITGNKAVFEATDKDPINRPALRALRGKKDLVGAEIGVFDGVNAHNMLINLDIKKLYLIDPYLVYEDCGKVAGSDDKEAGDKAKANSIKNLKPFEDKIVRIYKKSEDAIADIKDELDFVYIDGNHRYEYVKKDIELYVPLVKNGGLIAGHDYDNDHEENGVKRAVLEMFEEVLSDVDKQDKRSHDWWCFKLDSINRPSLRTLREKKDLVGAEIGVYIGENAQNMLTNLDIKKLYLIDPYSPEGLNYPDNSSEPKKVKDTALRNLKAFEDKIVWIHKKSEDAITDIKDELDFIYIDGMHTYEHVKKEIELYVPLVKRGGLIAGHDFDDGKRSGVKKAVLESFAEVNVDVDQQDSNDHDWWCFSLK